MLKLTHAQSTKLLVFILTAMFLFLGWWAWDSYEYVKDLEEQDITEIGE